MEPNTKNNGYFTDFLLKGIVSTTSGLTTGSAVTSNYSAIATGGGIYGLTKAATAVAKSDVVNGAIATGTNALSEAASLSSHALTEATSLSSYALGEAVTVGGQALAGARVVGEGVIDGTSVIAKSTLEGAKVVGDGLIDGATIVGKSALAGAEIVGNSSLVGAKVITEGVIDGTSVIAKSTLEGAKVIGDIACDSASKAACVGAATSVAVSNVALPLAGFTTAGITGGSPAAAFMATYGGAVAKGSMCATLQSAGVIGFSTVATGGLVLAGAGVGAGGYYAYRQWNKTQSSDKL